MLDQNEFWKAQAKLINWFKSPETFVITQIHHTAIGSLMEKQTSVSMPSTGIFRKRKEKAVIFKSSETNEEETYSYSQLYQRIQIFCKNFNPTKGSKRRQSNYLYANDSRGDLCNAGMRKDWGNTFCRFVAFQQMHSLLESRMQIQH